MSKVVLSLAVVILAVLVIVQQSELREWRSAAQRADKQTVECLAANSSLKSSFNSLGNSFDRCLTATTSLDNSFKKCNKELRHLADHVLEVLPGKESKIQ